MSTDAPQSDCPRDERRRDVRQSLVAKAILFNEDGVGAPYRIDLRNISVRGCGFIANGAVELGRRFRIKIEIGPMSFASPMRVVSARPAGFGSFEVGAEFLRNELALSDVDAMPMSARPQRIERVGRGILRHAI